MKAVPVRPRIAVSACLLGKPVRYDGRDKNCVDLQALADKVDMQAVCPEVGMGLPVPRPPMEVWQMPAGLGLRLVEDKSVQLGEDMRRWFVGQLPHWRCYDGFVLKSRSPSCGHGTTPVFDAAGRVLATADGLFVALLKQYFPHTPVIDENDLRDETCRLDFLRQARHNAKLRQAEENAC